MGIKRKDFQKAAAFINEFLLKLNEDAEGSELRDTLNLALLHMQKYYRKLQTRSHEKNAEKTLSLTARGFSPMTPFVDAPDKFQWKWVNLDNLKNLQGIMTDESMNITTLPHIMHAVKQKDSDLLMELVQGDPSCIDEQDGIGRTALFYAVHFHQNEMLNYLLENEADVNIASHDGSTALHQACHDANHVALSLLLQYGGDFTIQDSHGRAPIHWTVTTKSTECLKYLIQHNADVNIRDKDGLTPCMWACRLDHIKHFELLSSSPNFIVDEADGIERDLNGKTWMHWSVRRTEPLECLQTLLTSETAKIKDENGKTVLLLAAETGSLLACKIILDIAGRQRVVDRDNNDRSALHLASINGHGDVINHLLDYGADLNLLDKFNATAWDYARNKQLHYCQLIIMSHQRQRLQSNPSTPIPNRMGLSMTSFNGLGNGDLDYEYMMSSRQSTDYNTPITPPHPPKRPRTMSTPRTPLRRSQSLGLSENNQSSNFMEDNRQSSSAGGELNNRRKERIEVQLNHGRRGMVNGESQYTNRSHREDIAMMSDDEAVQDEEDVDGVSVGGMDVSDIEDEEHDGMSMASHQTGGHASQRSYNSQGSLQPRPPPRYPHQSSPPKQHFSQSQEGPLTKQREENQDGFQAQRGMQPKPPPKFNQRVISPHFNQNVSLQETFPPSRPRPAPRQANIYRQNPPRPPPPRRTPSPVRPNSGNKDQDRGSFSPESPEQNFSKKPSPPSEQNRPDSGSKPPGVVEGRKIPPPMLTPLENAPLPPSFNLFEKKERKKKKKKREREKEKEKERESDIKSPPMDIEPPRGYAAPLHPPPSANIRSQRAQSGIPAPRYSKQQPQRHESRYVDESMDEEYREDTKGPIVNGHAVPVRESPHKPSPSVPRLQSMDSEDYPEENGDTILQDIINEEDDTAGPLIPPPQGFRSPGHAQGRALSQSIPQDGRTARMTPTSAKPPIPSGRSSARSSTYGKSPSPHTRRSRPPTGRS